MIWKGELIKAAARRGAVQGLKDATEHALGEARKLNPFEEGTLERSGSTNVDEASLQGAITFDTPYAVRQHEELDYVHKGKGQSKYLETAVNQNKDTLAEIIAAAIRKEIG